MNILDGRYPTRIIRVVKKPNYLTIFNTILKPSNSEVIEHCKKLSASLKELYFSMVITNRPGKKEVHKKRDPNISKSKTKGTQ